MSQRVIAKTQPYSLGRILTLATNARAISWPVILVCAVLSVLIHLAPNGATVEGNILVRIGLAVLAYLPGLGTIAVASFLTRDLSSRRWRIGIMLLSFFLGGALRGLFLAVAFFNLGMANSLNLDFRIPGSAIPFGLAITVATYAVSALDESKGRISSLRALQAELSEAIADAAVRELSLREHTIVKLEHSVQDQLRALDTITETTSAAELKALAIEVIRPLSHSLAERVPVWEPQEPTPTNLRWRDILSQVRPELSLKPLLLTILSTMTGLTAFIYFFGVLKAIPLVLCTVVLLYSATRGLQLLSARFNTIPNAIVRWIVMTLLLMLVAVPAGLVDDLIVQDSNDPTFLLRCALSIVPIFGWFIALGGAAQAESQRIEGEFVDGIGQLSWLKARLNLVNWFEQGEFARVLHGPVQSAINQGIIKLSASDSTSRAQVIAEVRNGIAAALSPEFHTARGGTSFERQCADLAQTWASLCQIDFAISPTARSVINADPPTASVCWDIIHESCGNAIQHGKAQWISVRIADPAQSTITVEVIDNGTEYEASSTPGMGSNLLDACTLRWSRARADGQTALIAQLPTKS
jgi:hypothetical protein